jgi:hypothetical protein
MDFLKQAFSSLRFIDVDMPSADSLVVRIVGIISRSIGSIVTAGCSNLTFEMSAITPVALPV